MRVVVDDVVVCVALSTQDNIRSRLNGQGPLQSDLSSPFSEQTYFSFSPGTCISSGSYIVER